MVPNVTKFGDMKGFSFYPILVSSFLLYIIYLCHNIYFLSVTCDSINFYNILVSYTGTKAGSLSSCYDLDLSKIKLFCSLSLHGGFSPRQDESWSFYWQISGLKLYRNSCQNIKIGF